MKDIHSLSHTKWNCKYCIVFALKYRRKVFYGEKKVEIGKNTAFYIALKFKFIEFMRIFTLFKIVNL